MIVRSNEDFMRSETRSVHDISNAIIATLQDFDAEENQSRDRIRFLFQRRANLKNRVGNNTCTAKSSHRRKKPSDTVFSFEKLNKTLLL